MSHGKNDKEMTPNDEPAKGLRYTFYSLRYYNYSLWFGGSFVSNIGTWIQRVAQDWLVMYILTSGSPTKSGIYGGIVTALQFTPFIFLSPYGGLLADRLNRRKLLMATQSAMGILAFVLGVLTLTHKVTVLDVFIVAFLLGIVTAIDSPVRQTFVGEMVPANKLANAVGLNSMSFNSARLIGPAVGGLLIAWVGCGWNFMINGISFAATTGSLMLMRKHELHELPVAPRKKGQIREGWEYVKHRQDIIVIMVTVAVVSCLGLNNQLTQAQMAIHVFHKGPSQYGMLGTVFALGAVGGTLLAARREHPRVRLVVGAALVFGIFSAVYTLMPTYVSFMLSGAFVGFCTLTLITAANSAVQISTEPEMRGRVMSLYMLAFMGVTPVGSIVVGLIAGLGGTAGPRWSIGVGSIASIIVALWAIIWTRKHWHYTVKIDHILPPRIEVIHPEDKLE